MNDNEGKLQNNEDLGYEKWRMNQTKNEEWK